MESMTPPRAFELSEREEAAAADRDEKVSKLEKKLEGLYKARAGRPTNAWWAWCAECGRRPVNVGPDERALVNEAKSRTTQRCGECAAARRLRLAAAELASERAAVAECLHLQTKTTVDPQTRYRDTRCVDCGAREVRHRNDPGVSWEPMPKKAGGARGE